MMQRSHTPPLTTPEAAKYLSVKPGTLEVWRCQGRGPKFARLGRAVRYRPEDLDAFLEKNLMAHTSEA